MTHRRRSLIAAAALAAGAVLAPPALAQPKPAEPGSTKGAEVRSGKLRGSEVPMGTTEMMQKLASEDAAIRQSALDYIKDRLANQPSRVIDSRTQIFRTLSTGKHHADAADLAWFGVVTMPQDTRTLESFQQARVRALLALGKTDEALQGAKSLFNVCSMTGTSDAILIFAECLNAARPKDKDAFNKFREEQIAGATAPAAASPSDVTGGKGPRSTVMDSVKVDPKAYDEALAKITGEDYTSLMSRGNLLLMADKVKEAREVFERMYTLAGNTELVEASEALARCIRAEDGTIGRANAWVTAIKPKPAGSSAVAPPAPK